MHTFRKRGASNDDSSGSTGLITGGVALILAMGCSANVGNGVDMPGLTSNGGGAGIPINGMAGMNTQPFVGTCPSAAFQKCKACHDGRGTAGSPMGLVFFEDYHAPSHSKPSMPVYQILSERLHRTTPSPMPPDGMLDANTLQSVDAWVAAGAPDCGGFTHKPVQMMGAGGSNVNGGGGAGNTSFGAGGSTILPPGSGGTPINPAAGGTQGGGAGGGSAGMQGGTGGNAPYDITPYLSPDGTYFIKEPPGNAPVGPDAKGADYCFNLVAHNAQTPLATDMTPFQVGVKEFYHSFQYKAPYTKPSWALSTRPIIDNNKVLHHWLLFQMGGAGTDGSHADEIGLQLNNALLTGWAPGGNPLDMPAGVGLEMPAVGGFFAMEIHYFNTAGPAAQDRSGVRMCVTYTQPTNPASLTWLGTESINIPAGAMANATGTCNSWKKNVDVHVIQSVPHMHKTGTHMKTVINRAAGGSDILIDKPFVFNDQRSYPIDVTIHANDSMTTTCTFQNPTGQTINFGTSTTAEMCYNFVVYYPAHALDGVGGIEGSKNMCLF